jgi:hypothetical protein
MINPETNPIILAHEPAAADAVLDTSSWCDLSKAQGVLITVLHYRGGDTDVVLSVHEGTAASGTTAITATFPIWYASDALNDPTLARQTDAVGLTIDTGTCTGSQVVQFYIDASILSAGYRYVQLGASGGHASSIMSVVYQLVGTRYQQDEAL